MNRYQILIEYVGTSYSGWQIQKKGKTIQGKFQKVISKILKQLVDIIQSDIKSASSTRKKYEVFVINFFVFIKMF